MNQQVLFIQGAGEGAHSADAVLAANLRRNLGPDYEVVFPRMPGEDDPDDCIWGDRIVAELAAMGDMAVLVGHSAGAAVLCTFLAQRAIKQRIAGLFLIAAPFFGQGGWVVDGFELPDDLGARLSGFPVFLYHGTADEIAPVAHLDLYAAAIPHAMTRRLDGRNHQLDDDLREVAEDIRRLG